MAINSMDKDQIIRETVTGFKVRVQQHYTDVSNEDLEHLTKLLDDLLTPKVSDAAIQRRQLNPATDQVEEI